MVILGRSYQNTIHEDQIKSLFFQYRNTQSDWTTSSSQVGCLFLRLFVFCLFFCFLVDGKEGDRGYNFGFFWSTGGENESIQCFTDWMALGCRSVTKLWLTNYPTNHTSKTQGPQPLFICGYFLSTSWCIVTTIQHRSWCKGQSKYCVYRISLQLSGKLLAHKFNLLVRLTWAPVANSSYFVQTALYWREKSNLHVVSHRAVNHTRQRGLSRNLGPWQLVIHHQSIQTIRGFKVRIAIFLAINCVSTFSTPA